MKLPEYKICKMEKYFTIVFIGKQWYHSIYCAETQQT